MRKEKIKLLLVEDHDSVSLGVRYSLENSKEFEFEISPVSNADNAFDAILTSVFDIILLDIILKNEPENSKLKGGDDLLREFKKSSSKAKIIVMSKIESLDMLDYIINVLNADGYILKSRTSLQEIIPAIKKVLSNESYYSKSVTKILQYQENLLDIDLKDRFILKLLSQGLRQQEIEIASPKKGIKMTVSAIEKRIKKLKLRFGAETTAQLTAIAVKKGII